MGDGCDSAVAYSENDRRTSAGEWRYRTAGSATESVVALRQPAFPQCALRQAALRRRDQPQADRLHASLANFTGESTAHRQLVEFGERVLPTFLHSHVMNDCRALWLHTIESLVHGVPDD